MQAAGLFVFVLFFPSFVFFYLGQRQDKYVCADFQSFQKLLRLGGRSQGQVGSCKGFVAVLRDGSPQAGEDARGLTRVCLSARQALLDPPCRVSVLFRLSR